MNHLNDVMALDLETAFDWPVDIEIINQGVAANHNEIVIADRPLCQQDRCRPLNM